MPDNQVNNNLVSTAHNYVFTCWPLGTIELIIHVINAASNYSCGRRSSELLSLVLRQYFQITNCFLFFYLQFHLFPLSLHKHTHTQVCTLLSPCSSFVQSWTQTKGRKTSLTRVTIPQTAMSLFKDPVPSWKGWPDKQKKGGSGCVPVVACDRT